MNRGCGLPGGSGRYFLGWIATRSGETGCRTRRHTDWPAAARYTDPAAAAERREVFLADITPSIPLRPRGLRRV